jgi:hypothetical protein
MRRGLILIGAVLLSTGITTGVLFAVNATPRSAVPSVLDCFTGPPEARPGALTLDCGDGNEIAETIRWTYWGPQIASGLGVDAWNSCVPYCGASKTWFRTPATFVLIDPVKNKYGLLFSEMVVKRTGPVPKTNHPLSTTYDLTLSISPGFPGYLPGNSNY